MAELTFKVAKDIFTIRKHLTNVEKFVSVHPLIYKMTDLGGNTYKIFEKVKMGRISLHFTYKATITCDNYSVNMEALVMGLAKLSMHFTFQGKGDVTIIKERLTVQSLLPIKRFMIKLISKQHQEMFKNIGNGKNE